MDGAARGGDRRGGCGHGEGACDPPRGTAHVYSEEGLVILEERKFYRLTGIGDSEQLWDSEPAPARTRLVWSGNRSCSLV